MFHTEPESVCGFVCDTGRIRSLDHHGFEVRQLRQKLLEYRKSITNEMLLQVPSREPYHDAVDVCWN